MQPLATIPSPAEGVWHLGPLPLRAYAMMIIIGIIVCVWMGERRWVARGGTPGVVIDVAVWAVPFGLVGGRLYHVITDYQRYFGSDGDPVGALQVWNGGLGIWGAVALGAVGAWIGCNRRGVSIAALGDAIAPGLAIAQAIGRWGNWWNQELFGRPLDTWWALEIDPEHRPEGYADVPTYHPTFLYESLWCIGVAILVVWAAKRYKLTHGRAFALYVAAYTVGRFWIEALRIDEAHKILGLRLNDWTSLLVFAGAVAFLYLARNKTVPEAVTVVGADTSPAVPAEEKAEAEPAPDKKASAEKAEDAEPETEAAPKAEEKAEESESEPDPAEDEAVTPPAEEAAPAAEEPAEAEAAESAADTEPEAAADPEETPEAEATTEDAQTPKAEAAEDTETPEAEATEDAAEPEDDEAEVVAGAAKSNGVAGSGDAGEQAEDADNAEDGEPVKDRAER